jgi:tRNA dimethylallyltransferase
MEIAQRHGGVVINADSMQVYADLAVLTARPSAVEATAVPHRLFGHVEGAFPYSAAAWALDAQQEIQRARQVGALPVLVGGTGLYFRSLFKGLAHVPEVPAEIREAWRRRVVEEGSEALHRVLAERDPRMAARLRPNDPQRIARALEVIDATGTSLGDWQARATAPLVDPERWTRIVLVPERGDLARRIEARLEAMHASGAAEEANRLQARGLAPALPVMKAIGVAEFGALARGEIGAAEAIARAAAATRAYAKRQTTWFRTQMDEGWERVEV